VKRMAAKAIVIGVPLPGVRPAVARCDTCGARYPVQLATALTIAQAGAARPPVLCFACTAGLGLFSNAEIAGIAEARRLLGLDN
jgi:hypothetical protein